MDQQTQQQQLQQPPPRAEHPGFQVPASPVYPSNPELNSSAEKPPKRRKVAIACDECRVRKTKCDGVQPVCGPCAKRADAGVSCSYGTGRQRRSGFSKDYVSSLETRLQELERGSGGTPPNGTSKYAAASPAQTSATHVSPSASRPVYPSTHQYGNANAYETQSSAASVATPASQDRGPHRNDSKGVNAMMGAVDEPQGHGFFGSSSAASFIQQIKTAVDAKVTSPEARPSSMILGKVQLSSLEPRQKSSTADYVLPPRKTADGLLEVYWRLVHPLYPFLDRYEIMSQYQTLWTGEPTGCDENALMTTLNVIFALGCQLSDNIEPSQREASSAVFFARAKELLDFDLWEVGSVQTIQCLLIMGQYLQSTNSAHQCWIVIGLAVRTAQSLGFHLPQTDAQFKNGREMELARRLWHGCVMMDRILSLTFGRPFMISQRSADAVPLPAAIDDEYLSTDPKLSRQPSDRPPIMAFFGKSLESYAILSKILLALYTPIDDRSGTDVYSYYFGDEHGDGLSNVFELDRSLTNWSRTLPPYLRVENPECRSNETLFRQANILRSRFLHIRMLLFRPIMSRFCTAPDSIVRTSSLEDALPSRIALQCSILCVKVAQESIELIYSHVTSEGSANRLPAWWYNVLYTYTAATILLAARLRPQITSDIPEPSITHSWRYALEILRKYQEYSTSAKRCVAALEILYDRVPTASPDGTGPSGFESQMRQAAGTGEGGSNGEASQSQLAGGAATPGAVAVGGQTVGQEQMSATEFNTAWFDSLGFVDLGDMSWLNSVPSNLGAGGFDDVVRARA